MSPPRRDTTGMGEGAEVPNVAGTSNVPPLAVSIEVTRLLAGLEERMNQRMGVQFEELIRRMEAGRNAGREEGPSIANVQGPAQSFNLPSDESEYIPTDTTSRDQPVTDHLHVREERAVSAFSRQITRANPPKKFKAPVFNIYKGKSDPLDHIEYFETAVDFLNVSDAIKCRLFLTTFQEAPRRWFSRLPEASINSFAEFKRLFLAQFVSAQRPLKNSQALLQIKQEEGESLRYFINRFQREMTDIRDLEPAVAHAALTQGLREGPFRYALGLKQPRTLAELLEAAHTHINAEEYNNTAMISGKPKFSSNKFKNRMMDNQGRLRVRAERRNFRPVPNRQQPEIPGERFAPTLPPLRVSLAELVTEIQNKEYFKRPQPMRPGVPRDNSRYCAFHRDNGHDTEECRHLKILVEGLIKAGKLKEFLLAEPTRRSGKELEEGRPINPIPARVVHIAGIIPAIMGGAPRQVHMPQSVKKRQARNIHLIKDQSQEVMVPVTFRESDKVISDNTFNDAIVVTALISNYQIGSILIDTGSSVNLIFKSIYDQIREGTSNPLSPAGPLFGFAGERKETEGMISLPVTWGEEGKMYTAMVDFVIVDAPAVYNVIFGRPLLNTFKAVVSTYHLAVKFIADGKEVTIQGDVKQSQICYARAISSNTIEESHELEEEAEERRKSFEVVEPTEVIPIPGREQRSFTISTHLSPEHKEKLAILLYQNTDVFAWDASEMPGVDPEVAIHKLNINRGARPIKQKLRKVASILAQPIREEVEKLLKAKFIQEVQYPEWISNVVMVPKSNKKWRMCVDFTNLNSACPKDSYPLPRIDALVDSAVGYPVMSFLDAFSGYHQIQMNFEDCEKTAFITGEGLYCYRVMPFGLKNAGATYQRMMDKVFFSQKGRNLEVYVDDIMVKSKTFEEHLQDLVETFETLRKYQMRLNPLKCTFGASSGKFLGFLITGEGITLNPDKVRAITSMPSPQNPKEVQRLTGRIAALSRFIARLGEKSAPFFRILRGATKFNWTEECEEAFKNLKITLATPPLLQSPREGEDLLLYLGVGNEALSSVLVREEGKKQWPVYYVSKILRGAEVRYSIIEKLVLALVITARKLRPYFQAHTIQVITDHPLKTILTRPEHSGRLLKWAVELSEFNIIYLPRTSIKAQVVADFLTDVSGELEGQVDVEKNDCWWTLYTDGASKEKGAGIGVVLYSPTGIIAQHAERIGFSATNNQAEYEALIAGLRFAISLGAKSLSVFSDSQLMVKQVNGEYEVKEELLRKYLVIVKREVGKLEQFRIRQIPREENQLADFLSQGRYPDIMEVPILMRPSIEEEEIGNVEKENGNVSWQDPIISYLQNKIIPPEIKDVRRFRIRATYYFLENGWLYRKSVTGLNLRCVRETQVMEILQEIHQGECGSHSGGKTLSYRVIRQGYFWPTLRKDAEDFAKRCLQCQRFAPLQLQPSHKLKPISSPWPFAVWGMDLIGPLPPASGQRKYVLVMIDYFTKWIEAKALAKTTAKIIQNFIWTDIICRYGVPMVIITDNGPQFADKGTKEFCHSQGIRLKFASVHHPQANGQVEAANKLIVSLLKKKLMGAKGQWVDLLPSVLWALRTTPTRATGQTPFLLSHGTEAMLPVENVIPTHRVSAARDNVNWEEWQKENDEGLLINLDLAEELHTKAVLHEENIKQRMARYYNVRVREKIFLPGSLVMKKVDAAARHTTLGKLGSNWDGPYIVKGRSGFGSYHLQTHEGEDIPRSWSGSDLKKFYP